VTVGRSHFTAVKSFLHWLDGPLDRGDVWEHLSQRCREREAKARGGSHRARE